jgi:hypothetical protein
MRLQDSIYFPTFFVLPWGKSGFRGTLENCGRLGEVLIVVCNKVNVKKDIC